MIFIIFLYHLLFQLWTTKKNIQFSRYYIICFGLRKICTGCRTIRYQFTISIKYIIFATAWSNSGDSKVFEQIETLHCDTSKTTESPSNFSAKKKQTVEKGEVKKTFLEFLISKKPIQTNPEIQIKCFCGVYYQLFLNWLKKIQEYLRSK